MGASRRYRQRAAVVSLAIICQPMRFLSPSSAPRGWRNRGEKTRPARVLFGLAGGGVTGRGEGRRRGRMRARATSFWFTRVPRGRTHSPMVSFGLDGLKRLERGDDLRLRGSAVPAEQALLPAGPDGLASLGDGDGDGIGVDAVRNHLSVRVDPEDGVLGGVVLLLAPVSVLRRGGGKGGESASRRCRAHLLRREGRRVSTRSSGIPDGGDPRERSNPGSRDGRARGCAPGRARGRPPERDIFLI